jgi:hypothetical protein
LAGLPLDNKTWNELVKTNSGDEAFQALKASPWFAKAFPAFDKFASTHASASLKDYKDTENSYRDILASNGLKTDIADTAKVGQLMQSNINPTDFATRVENAVKVANSQDPATLDTFKQYFNLGKEDIAHYFLDPANALPKLQSMATAAQLGGIASGTSGGGISSQYALSLAQDAAKGGFLRESSINTALKDFGATKAGYENIAGESGKSLSNDTLVAGTLDVGSEAGIQLAQLKSAEAAKFSGSNAGTLSTGKDTSGTY